MMGIRHDIASETFEGQQRAYDETQRLIRLGRICKRCGKDFHPQDWGIQLLCKGCRQKMEPEITPEEFAEKMKSFADGAARAAPHENADTLMCDVLRSLGYGVGVEIFLEMDRWYD